MQNVSLQEYEFGVRSISAEKYIILVTLLEGTSVEITCCGYFVSNDSIVSKGSIVSNEFESLDSLFMAISPLYQQAFHHKVVLLLK